MGIICNKYVYFKVRNLSFIKDLRLLALDLRKTIATQTAQVSSDFSINVFKKYYAKTTQKIFSSYTPSRTDTN